MFGLLQRRLQLGPDFIGDDFALRMFDHP
jgi:hypothetical protein